MGSKSFISRPDLTLFDHCGGAEGPSPDDDRNIHMESEDVGIVVMSLTSRTDHSCYDIEDMQLDREGHKGSPS